MPRPSFPIVGIGASAGGVQALEGLFRHMPEQAGLGFVVVTHISSDRDSLLDEVVARYTAMPVVSAEDGCIQLVTLSVEPLAEAQEGKPLFLVLFADEGSVLSRETALARAQFQHGGTVAHLEAELRETRERLQSLIEEYETALEELKSTNEELEASKEELQSPNEELHTVNAELNLKVEALDRANGDLRNLFESTPLATVFLDRNLVIRSFTPAVTEIFNILPGDRGRPLTDLASRVGLADLSTDVAAVFASGRPARTSSCASRPIAAPWSGSRAWW